MLVLTRKQGEQIVINGDIVITVNSVRSGKVRLGFHASPEVPIVRSELMRREAEAKGLPLSVDGCGNHPDTIAWSESSG